MYALEGGSPHSLSDAPLTDSSVRVSRALEGCCVSMTDVVSESDLEGDDDDEGLLLIPYG